MSWKWHWIVTMLAISVLIAGCASGPDSKKGGNGSDSNGAKPSNGEPERRIEEKSDTPHETDKTPDVHYVPTPMDVVEMMLHLARVKKTDMVYDLGCGDGRIVVAAAKAYGCRAMGFDIDPERVRESLVNVEKNEVGHLVAIQQKDIFTLDLSKVNVVTLYLLPELNVRLIPQLRKMPPGCRIVSHEFDMVGVHPDATVNFYSTEDQQIHEIYLWMTPLRMDRGGDPGWEEDDEEEDSTEADKSEEK